MSRADAILERMRDDRDSDWPDRLLRAIENAGPLTKRETDVLRCASFGMNPRATSELLGVTLHTVWHHRRNAMRKMMAKTITHACCSAIRSGLIP